MSRFAAKIFLEKICLAEKTFFGFSNPYTIRATTLVPRAVFCFSLTGFNHSNTGVAQQRNSESFFRNVQLPTSKQFLKNCRRTQPCNTVAANCFVRYFYVRFWESIPHEAFNCSRLMVRTVGSHKINVFVPNSYVRSSCAPVGMPMIQSLQWIFDIRTGAMMKAEQAG